MLTYISHQIHSAFFLQDWWGRGTAASIPQMHSTILPFYLLFLEDYKLGWAWGMAILAAILELVGMITAAMSQKSD